MPHALGSGVQAKLVWIARQARPLAQRRQKIESHGAKRKQTSWPVLLFLLALAVPWVIYIGPMRMSLYRIVLFVMVLPCLGMWIVGKAGRIRIADIALMLSWAWGTLSFIEINGLSVSVQPSGIGFVETLGAYLMARCYIRDTDDFYNMVKLLFRIVAFLFPFAVIELITGQNILRMLFEVILPTRQPSRALPPELRSGLVRARSVFDHPILFGMCTGGIFALVYSVLGYRKSFFERALRAGIVAATALCSLSAGPFIGVVSQALLISWNSILRAVKARWKILIGLLVLMDLTIELFAKRSALDIIVSFFLFDPLSYWYRKIIWDYGSASVLNHPLFGIGSDEWQRPQGMPASIDNFWLALAVGRGLPAAFLLLLAFFSVYLPVAFKKGLSDKLLEYRTGFLISMTGIFLVSWTVAFWDHAYVLFLFLMGSGVWMLDVETKGKTTTLQVKAVGRAR